MRGILAALLFLSLVSPARAADHVGCYSVPVTPNTPTGIAGCEVWGDGIGSHYGPGNGVAMNFCTWALRHESGCGEVRITNRETGVTVTVTVIDFCDCWTGTSDERIVDMQYGVVAALGWDLARGLYPVHVEPVDSLLPNTALPR